MEALFYLEINKLSKLFYYREIIGCIDILLNYKQQSDINFIRNTSQSAYQQKNICVVHIEYIWHFKQ